LRRPVARATIAAVPELSLPETRYALTSDGVSLAYHVFGDGDVDLLWFHAFMGSLEVLWEHEVVRTFTEHMTSFSRLIRHDMRATGLSGRATSLPDLETQVGDAAAVLDAAGSRSTVIGGAGPGAHAALLFGATFPERTRALCLWDLYAWSGTVYRGMDLDLIARTWGSEGAAGAAMARVAPSYVADRAFLRWFAMVQRHFVPPDAAGDLFRMALETDITPLLETVHVPTLVLARSWEDHARDREIAERIPGARFELLPGDERATFAGDTAAIADAIRSFVGAEPAAPPATTLLRAVLFTDIVGSTERLAEVGDAAWREVLEAHDARAANAVTEHGGRVVKTTGDGLLAGFEGPAQAVRAAQAIGAAVADLGIRIRAGVHVGEVEARGDDVAGVTVHVAARVDALAGESQVLVTSTVKDLAAGSNLTFEPRGEHMLKGVPEPWRLYAATPGRPANR
jgi:class 3 adenylate cyclase